MPSGRKTIARNDIEAPQHPTQRRICPRVHGVAVEVEDRLHLGVAEPQPQQILSNRRGVGTGVDRRTKRRRFSLERSDERSEPGAG